MAIPKRIHYCWFGKRESQSRLIRDCIASWSRLDDYEVIEWNESNIDPGPSTYYEHMLRTKRYGFVSDIVRLTALYRMGGIYLDSDVEVRRKFPEFVLRHQVFLPFMFDCILGTAVLGAEPQSELIGKLLEHYRNLEDTSSPSNDIFTRFFLREFPEFRLDNSAQILRGGVAVYPKEYFDCPTYARDKGYAVHHAEGTWYRRPTGLRSRARGVAKGILGNVVYSKLSRYRGLKVSPFYQTYLEHRRKAARGRKAAGTDPGPVVES